MDDMMGKTIDTSSIREKFRIPKTTKELLSTLNMHAYDGPKPILRRIEKKCKEAQDAASEALERLEIEPHLSDEEIESFGTVLGAALFEIYVMFGASREVREAMDAEFFRLAMLKRSERVKR